MNKMKINDKKEKLHKKKSKFKILLKMLNQLK